MSKDTINSVAVIGLLGTIALEAFLLGRTKIIDIIVSENWPFLYIVIDEILIVITVGFIAFFFLGIIGLKLSEDDTD